MYDRNFLYSLKFVRNSYIVMDQKYNDYYQFWCNGQNLGCFFKINCALNYEFQIFRKFSKY